VTLQSSVRLFHSKHSVNSPSGPGAGFRRRFLSRAPEELSIAVLEEFGFKTAITGITRPVKMSG